MLTSSLDKTLALWGSEVRRPPAAANYHFEPPTPPLDASGSAARYCAPLSRGRLTAVCCCRPRCAGRGWAVGGAGAADAPGRPHLFARARQPGAGRPAQPGAFSGGLG